jgi:hypothetical protein
LVAAALVREGQREAKQGQNGRFHFHSSLFRS